MLIAVVSYLIDVIATLWDKAAFMHPFSLHAYYDPRGIVMAGHLPRAAIEVLSAFAVVTIAATFLRFRRRDFP